MTLIVIRVPAVVYMLKTQKVRYDYNFIIMQMHQVVFQSGKLKVFIITAYKLLTVNYDFLSVYLKNALYQVLFYSEKIELMFIARVNNTQT